MSDTVKLSNSMLSEKLVETVMARNTIVLDCNDYSMRSGLYRTTAETLNVPPGITGAILIVERMTLVSTLYVVQRLYIASANCYHRVFWGSGWSDWKKLAFV